MVTGNVLLCKGYQIWMVNKELLTNYVTSINSDWINKGWFKDNPTDSFTFYWSWFSFLLALALEKDYRQFGLPVVQQDQPLQQGSTGTSEMAIIQDHTASPLYIDIIL